MKVPRADIKVKIESNSKKNIFLYQISEQIQIKFLIIYFLFFKGSNLISKETTIPILISNKPIAIWGEGKIITKIFTSPYLKNLGIEERLPNINFIKNLKKI